MKNFLLLILAIILLAMVSAVYNLFSQGKLKTIKINGAQILVEIADSNAEKVKGLSGRTSLPKNQGMLFLYETPDYHSFWMKDMFFPLDFVWIYKNRVAEITENVKPEDYQPPRTLTPRSMVDAVLEINAGVAEDLDIKIGGKVDF